MRLKLVPAVGLAAAAAWGAALALAVSAAGATYWDAELVGVAAMLLSGLWVIATTAQRPFAPELAAPVEPAPPAPLPPQGEVSVEALADPAVLLDARLRVVIANASARALLGGRIVGEDIRLALRHPLIIEAANLAREHEDPVMRELMGFGRPENVFRLRAAALGDGRLLLTFSDVTQARLTERMRVDFVANASHELRTPLATLLGFIETLQGPAAQDEPARERFLDIMDREARRMSRLIDDLLSLSRIELDKYVPPRGTLAIAPVVADVGRTLAVRLDADQRQLVTDLPPDLPEVVADRDQLLQVLHNLVSNALKYGHPGTPIRIRAERLPARLPRGEPMLRVIVEDEGDGIAPEHLPRLTERFYRVDSTRSRSLGGTGLGLAIVKHIVERHRGALAITSRPGEGTTVSFTLPESRAAAVVELAPPTALAS